MTKPGNQITSYRPSLQTTLYRSFECSVVETAQILPDYLPKSDLGRKLSAALEHDKRHPVFTCGGETLAHRQPRHSVPGTSHLPPPITLRWGIQGGRGGLVQFPTPTEDISRRQMENLLVYSQPALSPQDGYQTVGSLTSGQFSTDFDVHGAGIDYAVEQFLLPAHVPNGRFIPGPSHRRISAQLRNLHVGLVSLQPVDEFGDCI